MKKTALALLASLSLGVSLPASAQEYMFTYSKLYTQLKNNTKEGHDDVKVAVFFVDQQAQQTCHISKAWMEKEEHYEELKVSSANELLLPVDQNLRSANPLIFVQTQEQECAYSLVVMTQEPLTGTVDVAQIESLLPQMQAMLEDVSGMFSGWFTPDIQGLTLEFANKLDGNIELSNGNQLPIKEGRAKFTLEELNGSDSITLPESTVRVMPYIPAQ
ncbi:DUF2987 domain-containing protein [Vibrio sp. 10N.261.46.E12]|uniref:DUF2987 domain-containing protein n=1 Tax=unclassified Vibrio TaxID=2614977 RepID=UPI000975C1C2|nr:MULTISPECIES: DUF2987 domain-containing protein [unclassified Vibrio]OMO38004.1 hypothetical protein BH584_19815 [Vibrio sp. 10N.261.45.E1]PMJ22011.1 hypothetical protein BCU27_17600 [Vibrio sp. 10N.286.45.B6]PML90651.1 hypothetical protein BCT66_05195 [Vibrio sp. 10N.261.49.E11]PMM72037.1 hypothetical protein BCT48_07125 [Vibrio sp. 10N.261.46.F12]PMM80595.1 hypothetical protein BCT46_17395 [Vibrio sp. 10N.261.46.E8]